MLHLNYFINFAFPNLHGRLTCNSLVWISLENVMLWCNHIMCKKAVGIRLLSSIMWKREQTRGYLVKIEITSSFSLLVQ